MADITKINVGNVDYNIKDASIDLTNYATTSAVQGMIAEIENPSLDGYATEDYVDEAIALIPAVDLEGYATEDYVDNAIEAIQPADLSSYATIDYVDEELEGKQDVLTAGDNITITDGVISASGNGSGGTEISGGRGIRIRDLEDSQQIQVKAGPEFYFDDGGNLRTMLGGGEIEEDIINYDGASVAVDNEGTASIDVEDIEQSLLNDLADTGDMSCWFAFDYDDNHFDSDEVVGDRLGLENRGNGKYALYAMDWENDTRIYDFDVVSEIIIDNQAGQVQISFSSGIEEVSNLQIYHHGMMMMNMDYMRVDWEKLQIRNGRLTINEDWLEQFIRNIVDGGNNPGGDEPIFIVGRHDEDGLEGDWNEEMTIFTMPVGLERIEIPQGGDWHLYVGYQDNAGADWEMEWTVADEGNHTTTIEPIDNNKMSQIVLNWDENAVELYYNEAQDENILVQGLDIYCDTEGGNYPGPGGDYIYAWDLDNEDVSQSVNTSKNRFELTGMPEGDWYAGMLRTAEQNGDNVNCIAEFEFGGMPHSIDFEGLVEESIDDEEPENNPTGEFDVMINQSGIKKFHINTQVGTAYVVIDSNDFTLEGTETLTRFKLGTLAYE